MAASAPARSSSGSDRARTAAVALLAGALLLTLAACGGAAANGSSANGNSANGEPTNGSSAAGKVEANATMVRHVDGDTIVIKIEGRQEKVRLIGINTPESVDPRRPVQCFGREASAHLDELLPPGTPLRIVRDVEARDRYDRLLAYVYRADDGLFVNLAQIRDGYARLYTFPPNVAHVDQLRDAERQAREAGAGLWSSCPS